MTELIGELLKPLDRASNRLSSAGPLPGATSALAGDQNSALPGVRGNGITSRTFAIPVT
jgi:hypothetical protein